MTGDEKVGRNPRVTHLIAAPVSTRLPVASIAATMPISVVSMFSSPCVM